VRRHLETVLAAVRLQRLVGVDTEVCVSALSDTPNPKNRGGAVCCGRGDAHRGRG
jgi:hypothetical protein